MSAFGLELSLYFAHHTIAEVADDRVLVVRVIVDAEFGGVMGLHALEEGVGSANGYERARA